MKKLSGMWELPTEIPLINMPTEVTEAEFDLYISVLDLGAIKLNRVILIPPGANYEFEVEGERLAIPVAAVIAEIEYQGETIPLPIYAQFDSNWEMDSRASLLTMHPQFAIIILTAVGQLKIEKEITVSDEFYNAFTASLKKSKALSGTWTFNDEVDFSPILRGGISASEMGGEALEGTKLDTIMLSDRIFAIGAAPNGIAAIIMQDFNNDSMHLLYLSQQVLADPESFGISTEEAAGLQAGWQSEEAKVIAFGSSPVYVSDAVAEFFRINATGGEIVEQEDGNVISSNEYQVNLTAYEANRALVSMSNLLKHSAEHKGKVVTATSNGFTLADNLSGQNLYATGTVGIDSETQLLVELDKDLRENKNYIIDFVASLGDSIEYHIPLPCSVPDKFATEQKSSWGDSENPYVPKVAILSFPMIALSRISSNMAGFAHVEVTLVSNIISQTDSECRYLTVSVFDVSTGTNTTSAFASMFTAVKVYEV